MARSARSRIRSTRTKKMLSTAWRWHQADKKMASGGLTSLDQQQYVSAKVTNQRHAASLINIKQVAHGFA